MPDTIRFRARNREDTGWVYFTLGDTFLTDWEVRQSEINRSTIQRFTGVFKKGIEICEGDILEYDGLIAPVEWSGLRGDPAFVALAECRDDTFNLFIWKERAELIIIGNTYENPELLK